MRGFSFLAAAILLVSSVTKLEASDTQRRYQQLADLHAQFESFLERVEEGQAPCHAPDCQLQKFQTINSLQRTLSRVPQSLSPLLRHAERALFAGYRLAEAPPPYMQEDTRLSSERKYHASQHLGWRGGWLSFLSDLYMLRRLLQSFQEIAADPARKGELLSLIDDGLLELGYHLNEARQWTRESVNARMSGGQAEKAAQKAEAHSERYRQYREQLLSKGSTYGLSLFESSGRGPQLFPGLNAAQSLQMLLHLRHWSQGRQTPQLFEAPFLRFVERSHRSLQLSIEKVTAFNDLEFGVVGLNNFESLANPHERNARDIQVHQRVHFWDSLDESWLWTGQFIFQWSYLYALLGPSQALTATALGPYLVFTDQVAPQTRNFREADRRLQLQFESLEFEEQMETRHATLLEAQSRIQQRLAQVEAEMNYLRRELKP